MRPYPRKILYSLDRHLRQIDEERWLSSRYAPPQARRSLSVLYTFYYELARIRLVATELGAIRFQWWRDTLHTLENESLPAHHIACALQAQIKAGIYHSTDIHELICASEKAFERKDRTLEPEAQLAHLAAKTLSKHHGQTVLINAIAPQWAALRRGETGVPVFDRVAEKVPMAIRPALAHFRLRRIWGRGQRPGPLIKRACICKAMMSGYI